MRREPLEASQAAGRRPVRPPGTGLSRFAGVLALSVALTSPGVAQAPRPDDAPIVERHMEASRDEAAELPRSEGDQRIVGGWPLYRTERGQAAFNAAMATLKATEGPAPATAAFKGCAALACHVTLPAMSDDGWLRAGRVWVSPAEYVLVVHSRRYRDGREYRRHGGRGMRYFVLHEFHNGTRNVDPYDTISSHSSSVFVPYYMSKTHADSRGRRFVVIVQVAPNDVVSAHATNYGSAGPGVEVAKNVNEELEPLQALAGIVLTSMVKEAAPGLRVVNHRGSEGQPMLQAWERRLEALRGASGGARVTLPFTAAAADRIAAARGRLGDLVLRPGASPRIPVAERGVVPARPSAAAFTPEAAPEPVEPVGRAARQAAWREPSLVEPIRPALRPASAERLQR